MAGSYLDAVYTPMDKGGCATSYSQPMHHLQYFTSWVAENPLTTRPLVSMPPVENGQSFFSSTTCDRAVSPDPRHVRWYGAPSWSAPGICTTYT